MGTKIWRAKAMGDTLYFDANSKLDAQEQLTAMCGPIPANMIVWDVVTSLPKGEEIAADMRR